jgi:hypothetical protein
MQVDAGGGIGVGERGVLVQEQDQVGALAEVGRRRAGRDEPPGLREEVIGEGRAIARGRARHETAPEVIGQIADCDSALTLSPP